MKRPAYAFAAALACACLLAPARAAAGGAAAEHPRQFGVPALPRADFNRLALHLDSPLYWMADRNGDGLVDPTEVEVAGDQRVRARFVRGDKFTPAFVRAYRALVELRRREAVARELDGGRPTLVLSDLRQMPPSHRAAIRQLVAAADVIEALYWRQTGAARFARQIRKADPPSRQLAWRNSGPWCMTPATRGDPFCNGLPSFPEPRSESYPVAFKQDAAMCKLLRSQPNAKALLDPFTVVRERGGKLVAVPYHKAYRKEMSAVAKRLQAAARTLSRDPKEAAFVAYLTAAARAFRTDDWESADEAWVAMNAKNSRYYLRVAPDEVYRDPCQQKAGFHVSFALIDESSLAWQRKLDPLKQAMEAAIARQIGPPYRARAKVGFHMPDFIKIILNAGDSRHPLGATIGQSLPNWGRVARRGRRTVVMTNLYTDPDSKRIARAQAKALLSRATFRHYTSDREPFLVNIIMHEASHNFGPDSDFRIKGKSPKEIFDGTTASILEELKAQTGALWFLPFLEQKGLLSRKRVRQAYVKGVTWAFGHISRGMVTPGGHPRTYSQVAAIQVGWLMDHGALSYAKKRFTINLDKMPAAIASLMTKVGQIKARGDKAGAKALLARYVKPPGLARIHAKRIARVLLKYPKATFRYAVYY